MSRARIIVGNVRAKLAELESESVHCVVTSPPYWGLRDYGVEGQIGLEETPEEWCAALVATFEEVRRVLRPDGTLWLNIGDSYWSSSEKRDGGHGFVDGGKVKLEAAKGALLQRKPAPVPGLKPKDLIGQPWMLAFALRAAGWYLRSEIIWHKPNPMPESCTDRPTKSHEQLFLLSKSARYFYDADAVREEHQGRPPGNTRPDAHFMADPEKGRTRANLGTWEPGETGRNLRDVWTIATHSFPGAHFATFPPKLVEPCIRAGTSEHGVCPKCGAPWDRVVERECEFLTGSGGPSLAAGHGLDGRAERRANLRTTTLGWQPTCDHADADRIPATVLDPFCGAGTTGLVAARLSRDFIGIELNPEYAAMARKRIKGDMPLFSKVT